MRYAGCLEHGEGIAEDIEEALYWYGKAAEQGVEIARVKLKSYQRKEE
jgi:TPR repeat protein